MRRLRTQLQANIAELPRDDFDVVYSFGEALRCAIRREHNERDAVERKKIRARF